MSSQKVIQIALFKDMQVTTNGTGASPTSLNLDVPKFTHMLPNAASIAVYGLVTGAAAADFEFWISFIPGFDRDHEQAAAIQIGANTFDSAAPGGARSTDYNTITNFLPEARLKVNWQNKAGVNGVKAASISAILVVTLLT